MNAKHSKKGNSNLQAGFKFGNLYKTIKDELNAIATASGGEITAFQLAGWLAELLHAETGGQLLGDSQRMFEMRRDAAKGHASASAKALYVRPYEHRPLKPKRVLSAKARKAISEAQKKRWAKTKKQKTKRKPTAAALATMRINIAKAQAARWGKAKAA